jgi:hypothetical protein
LPSLEVPVQAYPGIPLRSDRIRARSRAQQLRRASQANQPGVTPPGDGLPGIPGGGITVRPMAPQPLTPSAVSNASRPGNGFPQPPTPSPVPGPQSPSAGANWSNLVPGARPGSQPIAVPSPAPISPGTNANPTLPGFAQPVFPGNGTNPSTPRPQGAGQAR